MPWMIMEGRLFSAPLNIGTLTLLPCCYKAKVNAVEGNGWGSSRKTPLHFAWNVDMMRLLVDNGADMTMKDVNGQTPLHVAAERARIEKATFLLECGADIEAEDRDGNTPLPVAIRNVDTNSYRRDEDGEQGMVRLLLQNGAKVNVVDPDFSREPVQRPFSDTDTVSGRERESVC
jgi:ankyrin repeat protein